MEDPVVPLERNLYGHPLAGLLWGRDVRRAHHRVHARAADPRATVPRGCGLR